MELIEEYPNAQYPTEKVYEEVVDGRTLLIILTSSSVKMLSVSGPRAQPPTILEACRLRDKVAPGEAWDCAKRLGENGWYFVPEPWWQSAEGVRP